MEGGFSPDHVQDEWFEQYVMGTLPEEQAAILEERLLVDERCRLQLDQTEAYVRSMRVALRRAQTELVEPVRGPGRWFAWLARPVALAGAAAALAAVVFTVSLVHRPGDVLGPISETVELNAHRGGGASIASRPGHIQLRLDLRGIPERSANTVQVVTELGQEVWSAPLRVAGDFATVDVRQKLGPGEYLVRINAGPEQLREFRLTLQ